MPTPDQIDKTTCIGFADDDDATSPGVGWVSDNTQKRYKL